MEKLLMLGQTKARAFAALAICSTLVLSACDALDTLLEVDAPSRVVADDLADPGAAELLTASVANEFRCAATYHAAASALTGMEWEDASANTVLNIWDGRSQDTSGYGSRYASADCGSSEPAIYQPLSRTRWLADLTLERLNAWDVADVPNKNDLIAEVALYAAYTYLLFGEAMCSVAFSSSDGVGGAEQQPSDSWALAVQRFDESIAAGAAGDILNAARVGKARAQVNLGQLAAAAGTAAAVPAGFSWQLAYSDSDTELYNALWSFNVDDDNVTVGGTYRNMMTEGQADPRVSVFDSGIDHPTTGIRVWKADKYPAASTPMELASYEEAQLIVAENEIALGNFANAIAVFDALHTAVGLPAYSGAANATALTDQLVYERSAELFLEGQHLQDVKRFNIALFPAVGLPAPGGAPYSDELCYPLPATEFQNNACIAQGNCG